MSNDAAGIEKKTQLLVTIGLLICTTSLESLIFITQYNSAPGYIESLFTSGLGTILFLTVIGWQILGFAWLFLPVKSVVGYIVKAVLVGILCVLPVMLLGTVGPALITIVKAIGPIMQ